MPACRCETELPTKKCSKCGVRYCNRACQVAAFPVHKLVCGEGKVAAWLTDVAGEDHSGRAALVVPLPGADMEAVVDPLQLLNLFGGQLEGGVMPVPMRPVTVPDAPHIDRSRRGRTAG